jgi:DNA repair exonuclease SbcCD nuclease subunit
MQAAAKHGIEPRSISFKGAVQTLEACQSVIAIQGQHDNDLRLKLYRQLLDAIATYRVADRPNRFEPSLRKRRPKHYAFLRKPRHEVKRDLVKHFMTN